MREAEMKNRLLMMAMLLCVTHTASATDYLAASGETLFGKFCASCHGADAKGHGPVAKYMKVPPPDLTRIAQRHGGKFDADEIAKIVDGRIVIGAHGTRAMPIWGEEFTRAEIGEPQAEKSTQTVISRIVDYLRTLQAQQ
jgi:mono/diheme cytochrome c family protein